MSRSLLEQLSSMTTIVADTGDFGAVSPYVRHLQDSTTNPSLILAAAKMPAHAAVIREACEHAVANFGSPEDRIRAACDRVLVKFGAKFLEMVPGRVSTEVDARLSFDTEGTVNKALELAERYRELGITPEERVYFKIASTWEGIRAADILQKKGLACNLTLLFSRPQAIACAEAGVSLISPFVGRISDFYKNRPPGVAAPPDGVDPGVSSVIDIYNYLKSYNYLTKVMGASFRSTDQIVALAGCDLLTIAPKFLSELAAKTEPEIHRKLGPGTSLRRTTRPALLTEIAFRAQFNADLCANFKLAEGIQLFARDTEALERLVAEEVSRVAADGGGRRQEKK